MKIINKKNFLCTVCISYTFFSLVNIVIEIYQKRVVWSQINNLQIFGVSLFAVFLLSQLYRLENLPLLVAIVISYICFISVVMLYIWISAHYFEIHPNGYRDMFTSCTVGYILGVVFYEIEYFIRVRKQNKDLKYIKQRLRATSSK